ncbi:MAG: ABC transporter substrate-binding protein [Defluviitaleaceae bacterium]|nr:ABC transporter substrate-binding protein [Defluviitaleaceae bacterium]
MRRFLAMLFMVVVLAFLAACANTQTPAATPTISTSNEQAEQAEQTEQDGQSQTEPAPAAITDISEEYFTITDFSGVELRIPSNIETIVSIMPSNTEILVGLGFGEKIIATDVFSADVAGIAAEIAVLSADNIDMEYIISINPDIVIASDMLRFTEDNPLAPLTAVGIAVVYVPISSTISEIQRDIRFLGEIMSATAAAENIINEMNALITEISLIAENIAAPRTVYLEIEAAPFMFSVGNGVFLHELLETAGAINIFADQNGWVSVTDEILLVANPDVIITNVSWLDDPIAEIAARPGWEVLSAVQNGQIFQIDTNASSRPTQNITLALLELAAAIYPEYFSAESTQSP